MYSTQPSSIAANAAENSSDAVLASAYERTRSIDGSTTGDGCVAQRRPNARQAGHRDRQPAERARVAPAPLGRLDERERQHADGRGEQRRAGQVRAQLGLVAALAPAAARP